MSSPRAEIGSASLSISQAVVAFSAFLPNFIEVGKADKEEIANEVRLGETAAVAIALGIGGLLSWLSQSAIPFVVALLMCAMLVGLYETALLKDV